MAEPRHKIQARTGCDVKGCSEEAERSISVSRLESSGLKITDVDGGSAHLCKHHYREFKKKVKKDRDLERLGW